MNILFLGGDKRYKYMMEALSSKANIFQIGFKNMSKYSMDLSNSDFSIFDVIIFPMSGLNDNSEIKTEDGIMQISDELLKSINSNAKVFTGLKTDKFFDFISTKQIISFLDYDEVKLVNDSLTVDGVFDDIKYKSQNSICILGYGKLGKEIYLRLKAKNIKTYVISRPKEAIYKDNIISFYPLSSQNITEIFNVCDIAINTIPYNIIPEEVFSSTHIPYILDIASFPYGIAPDVIAKYSDKANYKLFSGIPSVFAPKKASEILLKILKKEIFLQ